MSNINKDALVDYVASKVDISKRDADMVVEALTDKIMEEVRRGNKVTLTGFGTFRLSKREAREGINPQTKERITIPAMNMPKFTAGKTFKETVKTTEQA